MRASITDQVLVAKTIFKCFLESAQNYSAVSTPTDLPSPVSVPSPVETPGQTESLSVTWHEKTGLIIAEKPGKPGVYEIFVPDQAVKGGIKLDYSNRAGIPTETDFECYAVGDLLIFDKNVTLPDSSVTKVQTFKVRYYSKTPDRFKNYVDNTIRMYSQTQ